jgi:hypothetical protein
MFKLGLFFVLLFSCPVVMAEEPKCFEEINVKINRLHPPIHIKDAVERRSLIVVYQQVECRTRKIIAPKSFAEALSMLDFALPLDYKAAIIKSISTFAYSHSDYGVSVEEDLRDYFNDVWLLEQKQNICYTSFGEKYKPEEEGCFWLLLEKLMISYRKGITDTEWTPS